VSETEPVTVTGAGPAANPVWARDEGPIRIVVAGENPLFRIGSLTAFAEVDEVDVVGEAGTGLETLSLARRLRPDVVLLDVGRPVPEWLPVLAELTDLTAVVLLTHPEEPRNVTRVMESGASGYLLHGRYDLGAFVRAVLDAARGMPSASPEVTTVLVQALRRRRRPPEGPPPAAGALTPRERDIITLIVEGLSNEQVADRLGLTVKTVKNNAQSIYGKLSVRSRAAAISVWLGRGEVRDEP
jgi:DNA-binding NarL/FixJ family response regulator